MRSLRLPGWHGSPQRLPQPWLPLSPQSPPLVLAVRTWAQSPPHPWGFGCGTFSLRLQCAPHSPAFSRRVHPKFSIAELWPDKLPSPTPQIGELGLGSPAPTSD